MSNVMNENNISGGVVLGTNEIRGNVSSEQTVNGGTVSRNQGGTYDYDKLQNHPTKDGTEIVGELTNEDLKIAFSKTTAEWDALPSLISVKNAVYIYTDYMTVDGVNYTGIKVGDGLAYVIDLPFVTAEDRRITSDDIENWNNKVAVTLDGETVIFYT